MDACAKPLRQLFCSTVCGPSPETGRDGLCMHTYKRLQCFGPRSDAGFGLMMSVRGLQWDLAFRGVQTARRETCSSRTVHAEATCQCFAHCLTSQACLVVGCMQPTFLAGPLQMSNHSPLSEIAGEHRNSWDWVSLTRVPTGEPFDVDKPRT